MIDVLDLQRMAVVIPADDPNPILRQGVIGAMGRWIAARSEKGVNSVGANNLNTMARRLSERTAIHEQMARQEAARAVRELRAQVAA